MEFNLQDFLRADRSDSQAVSACLQEARNCPGEKVLIFSGRDWALDESILLPSQTTVIIDGCELCQNDEVFDTVLRGDNMTLDPAEPYGQPLAIAPLHDIRIIGLNGATIAGCRRNRRMPHPFFDHQVQEMVGDFWGWRGHQIDLAFCDNFEICGLDFRRTRSWALSFGGCSGGYIHDLHLNARVKNGDGIDFRCGCHHCRVEQISGYTLDDTVACTALYGRTTTELSKYLFTNEPTKKFLHATGDVRALDIHDISIRGLRNSGKCHAVICLAAGGPQVYNIDIQEVSEASWRGRGCCLIYLYTGYGTGYTAGDLHDISIREVTARSLPFPGEARRPLWAAVASNTEVRNVHLSGIRQLGVGPAVDLLYPDGFTVSD
ncbi:MAG: hypothetical protein GX564_05490 [Oligosphaeraceae bacterium]|nr:hypothetical protein [Oligosphaeraceae bacterium]